MERATKPFFATCTHKTWCLIGRHSDMNTRFPMVRSNQNCVHVCSSQKKTWRDLRAESTLYAFLPPISCIVIKVRIHCVTKTFAQYHISFLSIVFSQQCAEVAYNQDKFCVFNFPYQLEQKLFHIARERLKLCTIIKQNLGYIHRYFGLLCAKLLCTISLIYVRTHERTDRNEVWSRIHT